MNWVQTRFFRDMHHFNVILKARQLGFSTFIMILMLDSCLFTNNHNCGVIAQGLKESQDLFDNKVKFAYDNLPDWIKESSQLVADNAQKLELSNGSTINVGTSLRSGTFQKLHISEFGKISAKFPDKAREIKTGALNTVHAGQMIFVESTAEGKSGEFYDLCQLARRNIGKVLTPLDPKFHFYPWFDNPSYVAEPCVIPKELDDYLSKFDLTAEQKAWYYKKELIMGADMKQEFPSTPDEAFEGSMEGAFYRREMEYVRTNHQIRHAPYDSMFPVHTFWDIGQSRDQMSIWYYQHIRGEDRFINYHESNNNGWDFYAQELKKHGYNYAKHFFPHDGNKRIVGKEILTTKQLAQQVGIRPIEIIPVTTSVWEDIMNYCRPALKNCIFDERNTAKGVIHLDNYRRRWDKTNAMWMNEADHDEASHGADAFRTFAVAKAKGLISDIKPKAEPIISGPVRNWMAY